MNDDGIRSALMAIDQLNHATVNNVSFECTMSHGLKTYMLSLTHNARTRLNLPADRIFAMLGSDASKTFLNSSTPSQVGNSGLYSSSSVVPPAAPVSMPRQVLPSAHLTHQLPSSDFSLNAAGYSNKSVGMFPRPTGIDTMNQSSNPFSFEIISPRTTSSVTPTSANSFESSRSGSTTDSGSQLFTSFY